MQPPQNPNLNDEITIPPPSNQGAIYLRPPTPLTGLTNLLTSAPPAPVSLPPSTYRTGALPAYPPGVLGALPG